MHVAAEHILVNPWYNTQKTELISLNSTHTIHHISTGGFFTITATTINVNRAGCGDENAQGKWQGADRETFTMMFHHQTRPQSLSFPDAVPVRYEAARQQENTSQPISPVFQ